MAEGFYQHGAYCENCDYVGPISIAKGTTVVEYFEKSVKCPNCGCVGLLASEGG